MTPTVGDFISTPRLGECQIVRILPLGTYEVRKLATDSYFRVSGLCGATWVARERYQPAPGSNFEPTRYESTSDVLDTQAPGRR